MKCVLVQYTTKSRSNQLLKQWIWRRLAAYCPLWSLKKLAAFWFTHTTVASMGAHSIDLLPNQPATTLFLRFCSRQLTESFWVPVHINIHESELKTTYNVMSCKWEKPPSTAHRSYTTHQPPADQQLKSDESCECIRAIVEQDRIRRVCSRCIASEDCHKILIYHLSILAIIINHASVGIRAGVTACHSGLYNVGNVLGITQCD